MTATIQKWGNSLALRIPKTVAQQIGLSNGDHVDLRVHSDTLVVRPARRRYRVQDLVRKITAQNRHGETDWGKPIGKEFW